MKKIISLCILLSALVTGFAQTFSATIQPLPTSGAGVIVYLHNNGIAALSGKVSSLTITLAIPTSVGARPLLTLQPPAGQTITYDPNPAYLAVNQVIDGESHYIYNILGTGDNSGTGQIVTFGGGSDTEILTVLFSGNPGTSQIKMVSLPDGGTDPNPNSYFGFSVDGVDRADEFNLFYGIPFVSEATNDGQGYAGTSFARTIPLVPLPVKFTSFNAVKKDKDALLTWSIENESANADHYEVERSLNSVDFTNINIAQRKLNGATTNSYTYTDANLTTIRSSGLIYYRIRQVDKDGKFAYTGIRSVKVGSDVFNVSVYPNPVTSSGTIDISLAEAGKINILLIDANGKIVHTAAIEGMKGLNTYPLNMNALASGSYMVKVIAGNEIRTIPVVKKK
jgi:hypothetical protein